MGCPADWIISTTSLASIVSWRQCAVRSAFAQMALAREMRGPGRGYGTKSKSFSENCPLPIGFRDVGTPGTEKWVLTSGKTLCEYRLEHTKVQFRQWLRCFSRPCWSWKSYNENHCRHTKRSTPPINYSSLSCLI